MSKNRLIIFATTFVFCLILNLVKHNQLLISLLNSVILLLSFLFIEIYSRQKINIHPAFVILFGTIPLFSFNPNSLTLNILLIAVLLFWIIGSKFNKLKIPFFILGIILFIVGLLVSNKIIYLNGSIDHEKLIFNNPISQKIVSDRARDAVYLPYRLRPFVYNASIFVYSIFGNIFQLLSFKTLYDILLLANLYPLILGFDSVLKSKKQIWLPCISLIIAFIIFGLNRSPDKFNSLYFLAPIFLYFIISGFKNINQKIYSALFLLSLFVVLSP